MADAKGKKDDDKAATSTPDIPNAADRARLGIRLQPVANSDQPIVANYTNLNIAPGMVFIDFGFLEPGLMTALPRVARAGGKLPESVNGKLAVRVAMGYDGLANLHQQIGRMLNGLREASAKAKKAS